MKPELDQPPNLPQLLDEFTIEPTKKNRITARF
jgi:hypothetical protein